MWRCFVSVIYFYTFLNIVSLEKLPSFVKTCQLDDANLNKCLQDSFESLRPFMKTGIRRFKIPELDPLFVPYFRLETDVFETNFTDATFTNLYNFTVVDLKADPINLTFSTKLNFKNVSLVCNYSSAGQLLVVYLDGFGRLQLDYNDADMDIDITFDKVMRNGKLYGTVKSLKVNITPKEMMVDAENLIKGNPALTKSANQLINQNILQFYAVGAPTFNKVAEDLLNSIVSYVFDTWTINKLFNA